MTWSGHCRTARGDAALLGDLISVLLAPYDDTGAFSGRIRVAVERTGVGKHAATSLAWYFTNSRPIP